MRVYGFGYKVNAGLTKKISAEAIAWQSWIIDNGGTIPADTLKIFDTIFFKPAKLNGNILTELDRLNIWAGLNDFPIAARTNTIKNAHFASPVSSPIFDSNGYKSGGTGYLNLNYNPATEGVKFTQNSASFGYFVLEPGNIAQRRAMGAVDVPDNRIVSQRQNLLTSTHINDTTTLTSTLATTGKVFLATVRTGASARRNIVNTTESSDTQASSVVPSLNQFELCWNFRGSPLGTFDDREHLASFHGSANLDYVNLRLILLNLFTALGV
jgi:hypothetical protein